MADENNQDMSMEDILSSIKNILEEDQSSAQPELEPEPKPAADEDVLDLTADMRLPQAEETIDLDAELDLWFSSVGKVRFEFAANCNVQEINRVISEYVLNN